MHTRTCKRLQIPDRVTSNSLLWSTAHMVKICAEKEDKIKKIFGWFLIALRFKSYGMKKEPQPLVVNHMTRSSLWFHQANQCHLPQNYEQLWHTHTATAEHLYYQRNYSCLREGRGWPSVRVPLPNSSNRHKDRDVACLYGFSHQWISVKRGIFVLNCAWCYNAPEVW